MIDEVEPIENGENPEGEPDDEMVSRLPGKFLADDPGYVDRSVNSKTSDKVLLPDGKGGVTSVSKNIVKIEHQGQTIELIALSPEEKRKRQFWINLVSILLGVCLVVLFFWLVY